MSATGITFIDDLSREWGAGAITRDDALERLLPWEDDLATRTQEELEAAWALRQQLEAGGETISNGVETPPFPAPSAEQVEEEADGELQEMLADLRANPLISREDIVEARAICTRLVAAGVAPDAEYVRTRCGEVEEKVASQVATLQNEVEEAARVLQDSPDIEHKLAACNRIRDALGYIEMLHPEDITLPDMVAWCEQTERELKTLLAERDLLLADVSSLTASNAGLGDEIDIGLVESIKQRLIVMSDTPLAKDDTAFRRASKELGGRLDKYLAESLKAGAATDKQAMDRYERVLLLARQAPEAIDAEKAKSYRERLASAQAKIERGSEPPARTIPPTPPPQPRSTVGSQPNAAGAPASVSQQVEPQFVPVTRPPATIQPRSGSTGPVPPPPRAQTGGTTITSLTQPISYPNPTHGTLPVHGSSMTVPTANTGSVQGYPQQAPVYSPAGSGLKLAPAAWAGIAVGAFALIIIAVVVIILATSRGSTGGTNTGGNSGAGDVARDFYQHVQAKRYQNAINLLTPDVAGSTNEAELRTAFENREAQEGAIQNIEVSNVRETGDTGQATVTLTHARGSRAVVQLSLQKIGGRWLISNFN